MQRYSNYIAQKSIHSLSVHLNLESIRELSAQGRVQNPSDQVATDHMAQNTLTQTIQNSMILRFLHIWFRIETFTFYFVIFFFYKLDFSIHSFILYIA